ncbi:hypothetical protein B0H11DRAFT_1984089 [Mycena galericulata]|nr:hypothetical protein B0H11DRAFT_1984089 [Mycena galericulata]
MASLTNPTHPPYLPPEIWRVILRYATTSQTSYDIDYQPFQPLQELQETSCSLQCESRRLHTCVSLVRVSRRFRALAVEFLYEDIRICDAQDLDSLLLGLMRSANEDDSNDYGSYVRRLEIPRRRTNVILQSERCAFPTHPIPVDLDAPRLVDLLRLCPNLEVLVRPCLRLDPVNITFWASLIGTVCTSYLPRLLRLEWHESELDSRFYGTNHIERLRELVSQAPNLRYLFLSSDRRNSLVDLPFPLSLRTIRLNPSYFHPPSPRHSKLSPAARNPSSIPNFHNLVLHTMLPSTLLDFLSATGRSLRVLELAFSPQIQFSSNQMQRILGRCPHLEELVYSLGAPEISPLVEFQCPSLIRVRLKLDPEEWNPSMTVRRNQLAILEGRSFPGLKEIILHDSTRWFVRRDTGKDFLRRMVGRECVVKYEDGELVPIPI